MKLATFLDDGRQRLGVVVHDRVVDLTPAGPHCRDMIAYLTGGDGARAEARRYLDGVGAAWEPRAHVPVAAAMLCAPVPRPGKIVAIGRNYADHAAETGVKPFEQPRLIAKLSSSVTGPGTAVMRPPGVQKLDFEVELGVVIGARAKAVPRADALAVVGGYTILNDVSAREWQFDVAPPQTTFAKSMDGFCPMGPWLVTADEIPDPQRLTLELRVNDELMQAGDTRQMIFGVAELIHYITRYMTLEPGDVIATGTPSGVGAFRHPPRWLVPGDRVRLAISAIGSFEHSIG